MHVIPESVAAGLVTVDEAITAVRDAFAAMGRGLAAVFPVVTGSGSNPDDGFAAKSARVTLADGVVLGVKIGTYWPRNPLDGRVAHASTVLLLDDRTGFPAAVVGAAHLTALRTAAADAVAVDALARPDASRLVVVGTGHQAEFDALAIARVRTLTDVVVCGRDHARAEALARRLADAGLPARTADLDDALPRADIVSTVTSSRIPLVRSDLVAPGTHISAMGADSPGKGELDTDLVRRATLVADVPAQSVTIGEFQHAAELGLVTEDEIALLGEVLVGTLPGRSSDQEITIFDSSGTAIQDLAVCALAHRRAVERGAATSVG